MISTYKIDMINLAVTVEIEQEHIDSLCELIGWDNITNVEQL